MCRAFKCAWLSDHRIPEWLKPEISDAILSFTTIDGIPYLSLLEAGKKMDSKVLSWVFLFAIENLYNLAYQVDGGMNTMGTKEFRDAFSRSNSSIHQ